jgi:ABC-2 type transport system ATP-binding protein
MMSGDMLVCKGLSKKYEDGHVALDKLNLSLPTKGIFALIGKNGAGKTTLTRILATELMPTSGKAYIDGMDVVKDVAKLRDKIAILPQESRAVQWLTPKQTVYSYLLYRGFGHKEAMERVDIALKELGVENYKDTLNRFLSGGMKRKILVATILASDAKILFVDEPTTGLDPISRADLWKVLNKLKKDHFIFLTTHYLDEAEKLADMIGILDEGKILGLGTLEELRNKVKYQYSIRVLQKNFVLKSKVGTVIRGVDGSMQILTSAEDADRLSSKLIKDRIKFSINPTSLEDIFYYLVKKPIEEDTYES